MIYQVVNTETGDVRFLNGTDLLLDDCPNFTVQEFASKDGNEIVLFKPSIVRVAQSIRDKVGVPIKLNSAFRTYTHNKAVGGADGSKHPLGEALDFDTPEGMTTEQFLIEILLTIGNNYGIGLYESFVHVDDRGYSAFWRG